MNPNSIYIEKIEKITSKEVIIKLSNPTKLKNSSTPGKTYSIDWDTIGRALFENYTKENISIPVAIVTAEQKEKVLNLYKVRMQDGQEFPIAGTSMGDAMLRAQKKFNPQIVGIWQVEQDIN